MHRLDHTSWAFTYPSASIELLGESVIELVWREGSEREEKGGKIKMVSYRGREVVEERVRERERERERRGGGLESSLSFYVLWKGAPRSRIIHCFTTCSGKLPVSPLNHSHTSLLCDHTYTHTHTPRDS